MWNPPDSTDRSGWTDPNQGQGWAGQPPGGPPAPFGSSPGGPLVADDPLVSPDYAGWWTRAIDLLKRGWRPLLVLQLIAVVVGLPFVVYTGVLQTVVLPEWEKEITAQIDSGGPLEFDDFRPLIVHAVVLVVGGLVAALVYWVVLLACLRVAVAVAAGGTVSVSAALKHALRRLLPMIGWQIVGTLLIMIGICACILPGIYVIAVLLVMPTVVAFEWGANGGAIARSFRLFHGDLGSSAARVATMIGLYLVLSIVVGVIAALIQIGVESADQLEIAVAGSVVSSLIQLAVQAVVAVCGVPLLVTAYADMRARVEPFSTAVLVDELSR